MVKDGDKIFALYQTDEHHSYDSSVLFVLGASKEDCINKVWEKYGEEQNENNVLLTQEMRDELLNEEQTQGNNRGYEFEIIEFTIGEMEE